MRKGENNSRPVILTHRNPEARGSEDADRDEGGEVWENIPGDSAPGGIRGKNLVLSTVSQARLREARSI